MEVELAEPLEPEVSAFRHVSKPEWGAAVLAWEVAGKRGYQFEDGRLRVFKEGYYHLLEPTLLPPERGAVLLAQVATAPKPGDGVSARKPTGPRITLDRQIEHLLINYPGGFAAEPWRQDHRDRDDHALKRHREPALERARRELSREQLDQWLREPGCQEGWAALQALLSGTDLVPTAEAKRLARGSAQAGPILERLRDLLWTTTAEPELFDRWVDALGRGLGRSPTWPLATAPAALVHPQEHACVRPAALTSQAAGLIPALTLRLGKRPTAGAYYRARDVVTRVRDQLTEHGVPPADLLDVTDFIWATLRPAARAEIESRLTS